MMGCYCDYEQAKAYWPSRPIARKAHRCEECGRQIRTGERYERVRAIWADGAATFSTCVYCMAQRDLIEAVADCFCWQHGNLLDDIQCWLDDTEIPGIRMAIGRLMIERKHEEQK